MHKTYNTETQRPYTISMIERLMREIHFAVDPHSTSKKQVSLSISLNDSMLRSSHLFNCYNDVMMIGNTSYESYSDVLYMIQALELIQELQKHFPIKRCPLRIRATAPQDQLPNLLEKLKEWNATVISKEGSSAQLSVVSTCYFLYSCKQR